MEVEGAASHGAGVELRHSDPGWTEWRGVAGLSGCVRVIPFRRSHHQDVISARITACKKDEDNLSFSAILSTQTGECEHKSMGTWLTR